MEEVTDEYLKELGRAVLAMPANSSLAFRPLNSNEVAPTGCMPWVFNRIGEGETHATEPLKALTFHNSPCLRPPSSETEQE